MRRIPGVIVALGLALLITPRLAAAPDRSDGMPTTVEADVVELDLAHQSTKATGHARLAHGSAALHADQIEADQSTGQVAASGGLALIQEGRRLEGESLTYNLHSQEGALRDARVQEQGVLIRGQAVEFSPLRVVAHNAYFTTCNLPQPDYTLAAESIILTAVHVSERSQGPGQAEPGQRPESGRLTLDRAHVTYHGRRLLTLPRYSVSVGQLGEHGSSPFPASGFDREDGPYASISYSIGRPERPTTADLSYRYTSFRGIRGYLKLRQEMGPVELVAGYVRREVSTDRELQPDDFTTGLANVMVNRTPELRASLKDLAIGRSYHLRAELSHGWYSETEHFKADTRARADRLTVGGLLAINPYPVQRHLSLSHAVGWRRSIYSPGDELTIRFLRHSLDYRRDPDTRLSLSYVTRRGSGATPFLFDQIEVGRELLADLRFRLSSHWRLRFADLYDLERGETRDMMLAATRTVHCLDYTFGWRKARGSFFVGINLAPPASREGAHE
jgi:lipopolysaccharide export system protein LptA